MALFKFSWPGQKHEREQTPVRRSRMAQAESVEDMRRRARHRLIGAAVLVVLGVIGFPILFDTQPRPIPVDVPIEIPDRNQVAPLMIPSGAATSGTAPVAANVGADDGLEVGETLLVNTPTPLSVPKPPEPLRLVPEPLPLPAPVAPPTVPAAPVQAALPAPKAEAKPEPAPPAKSVVTEADRARALLEGRAPAPTPVPAPAAALAKTGDAQQGRFIVQVGAFADVSKANEVRSKLERAGLKTYTQKVDTKDGARTRVRVGPFEQRTAADAAADRIKALGLAASVLTL